MRLTQNKLKPFHLFLFSLLTLTPLAFSEIFFEEHFEGEVLPQHSFLKKFPPLGFLFIDFCN